MRRRKDAQGNWRPSRRINTFKDLIEFLSLFSPTASIAVEGTLNRPGHDVYVETSSIATVLRSDGEEIVW